MKQRTKNILLTVIIALLSVSMITALTLTYQYREDKLCENIHLKVNNYDKFQFVSEDEVRNYLQNSDIYPVGKHYSQIDLTEIEKKLMELKMVNRVICSFANNGDVNVAVIQRLPLFRVKNMHQDYYIDTDRKPMTASIKYSAYVPLVTGNVNLEFATTELYDFIKYLTSKNRWSASFTQLYVYPDNEVELIPRVGDFIIEVGSLDNYKSKLDKLDKFLEVLPEYYSWDKYSVINLKYKNQVVCTKRKK